MIPLKNKKKSFEDTVQEMRDFSMYFKEKSRISDTVNSKFFFLFFKGIIIIFIIL